MNTRRKFIQHIALATGSIALMPQFTFAQGNSKKHIIVIDAVHHKDLETQLPTFYKTLNNYKSSSCTQLVTNANIDSHEACISELQINMDAQIDINKQPTIQFSTFNNLLIEGFDAAHYNYNTYLDNLKKLDMLLTSISEKLMEENSQILILSSLGRDEIRNEIAFENELGGTDHHTSISKKCWSIEISKENLQTADLANIPTTTRELVSQFQKTVNI